MQVLVFYYSRTGNTEKLADMVADGARQVDGVDVVVKPAEDVTQNDFLSADGLIAGSPVYFGSMAAGLKDVFDRCLPVRNQMSDRVGGAFCTSGDMTGGKETTMLSILEAWLIYGMIVVGDPMDATGHYGTACVAAPDDKTASNAAKLGKRVAELAVKLRG